MTQDQTYSLAICSKGKFLCWKKVIIWILLLVSGIMFQPLDLCYISVCQIKQYCSSWFVHFLHLWPKIKLLFCLGVKKAGISIYQKHWLTSLWLLPLPSGCYSTFIWSSHSSITQFPLNFHISRVNRSNEQWPGCALQDSSARRRIWICFSVHITKKNNMIKWLTTTADFIENRSRRFLQDLLPSSRRKGEWIHS